MGRILGVCLVLLVGCSGDQDTLPSAPIEILIDEQGVAHVYAQNDLDAFYGAGYQTARDRLYQMEMLRRLLTGRLSEVLGRDTLERDTQLRMFRLAELGVADMQLTRADEPELAALIDAWTAGVNRYVDLVRDGREPLPFGFSQHDFLPDRWADEDPYLILKGAALGLGRTLEFELAITLLKRAFPDAMAAVELFRPAHSVYGLPPEDRPQGPIDDNSENLTASRPARLSPDQMEGMFAAATQLLRNMPGRGASNNWAVDGRHTDTGTPLIAGDPHMAFDLMGSMYPLHINSRDAGGTFDVAGFAFPGFPGIALGHNDRFIWTQTTAFGDVMDVWEVQRRDTGVMIAGTLVDVRTREETIIVRGDGMPVGQGEEMLRTYDDVPGYGVLLPRSLLPIPVGGPYMVNWTGFEPEVPRWPMALNRVRTLDEFDDALDVMGELNQSVVGADATGIAYGIPIRVPMRQDVSGPRLPWVAMPGDDPLSYWTGERMSRDLLPRSRAAERGWIATANNDPYGFTGDGRLDNDPFYYGAFYAPGYRAQRIESEIARIVGRGGMTFDEVVALQMDTHSVMADDLLPILEGAWSRAGRDVTSDADLATVVRVVTEWDRRMTRDSSGALAFHAYVRFVAEEAVKDDISLGFDLAMELQTIFVLKVVLNAIRGLFPDGDEVLQGGRDGILLRAVERTATWLDERFGGVDPSLYRYGDLKMLELDHGLGFGVELDAISTDGGEDTVNVSQNITFGDPDGRWVTRWVSVQRTVGTFASDGTPEAWVNYPLPAHAGADIAGPRLDAYVEGRHERLLFRRAEIEAAVADRLSL